MKIDGRHLPFFLKLKELGVDIEEFLNECNDIEQTLHLIQQGYGDVIDTAFIWGDTERGHFYWHKIHMHVLREGY